MSSNPPDPNELVNLIVHQLQQQRAQQAQPPPAPAIQPYNQGVALSHNPDLENVVAHYLNASQGQGQMGAATNMPMPPAAAPSALTSPLLQSSNDVHRSFGQASSNQLLTLTGLLSSLNQNMAAAAAQQFAPQTNGFSAAQPQQDFSQQGLYSQQLRSVQQGLYPQGQQLGHIQQQQQGNIHQVQTSMHSLEEQHKQNILSQLKHQDPAQPPSMQVDEERPDSTVDLTQASVTTSTRTVVPSNEDGVISNRREQAPQHVNIAVLQTWTLEQLESHAKKLEEFNKPVPKIVRILLDDARLQKEKQHQKRLSNRKSATVSRARKRKLIDELTADNTRLRRHSLILSYLPDPVIAIGVDGVIKFCNAQIERVLSAKSKDLVGTSIKDIVMPESRGAIRRLVQDLVTAEHLAAQETGGTDSGGGEVVSSDQSFSVLEVNFDGEDETGKADENMSDSSSDPRPPKKERTTKVSFGTAKPCSRSVTASAAEEDSGEPPVKKTKTAWTSSSDSKTSGDTGMNVDDVMGASVTPNNASAKLSSLIHNEEDDRKPSANEKKQEPLIHRKHGMAPKQQDSRSSSSSTESDGRPRTGLNSSEDSGYMDSNSNGSSDESPEDISDTFWKKGNRLRPLAPGAMVRLICSDQSTMWCELTSSIHTRNINDEDPEIGIVDLNPSKREPQEDDLEEEKEVILCFRPIIQGEKVGEEFQQVSESSNAGNNSEQSENQGNSNSD